MAGVIPLEIGWLRGWELGDLEGAERALARAARLGPSARQAEGLRARVLERLDRSKGAKRAWETGGRINPAVTPGARLGSGP
jgi:cytochrome c-type biogenesis protein CcmH/NrfG